MTASLFWFRSDLRLADNPALSAACSSGDRLLLIALSADDDQGTTWGFPRFGAHRRTFRNQALAGLKAAVESCGNQLLILRGEAGQVLPGLARQVGADRIFCEAIAAPEEMAEVAGLRSAGLKVYDQWQSSLLDPAQLPFRMDQLPEVFTAFRQAIERKQPRVLSPMASPEKLPPLPGGISPPPWEAAPASFPSPGASFPFDEPAFHGSERAALSHLDRYFGSALPQTYKSSRNGLMGTDYSTKLSPWLAVGALSPRTVYERLKAHEATFGANESTYWIWFEMLWRDFFRFASLKHGKRLFHARGLSERPVQRHDDAAFRRWCAGETGQPLIDAAMRELAATGFLSNRMRQLAASYLVHELSCDWRAGAAWFESRLIDYDVYSNQGNWLYVAGRGADPRGGRRFDLRRQAASHDAQGEYQERWRTQR